LPVGINVEVRTFFYSVMCGMLTGLIYDFFRIKRKTIKTGTLFIYLEDLVYWFIVAAVVFALIFYSNDGEIRGYIFIGIITGAVLYALLFSKVIVNVSVKLLNLLGRAIKFIFFIVLYPFRIVIRLLSYPAKLISGFIKKLFRRIKASLRIKLTKVSLLRKTLRNMIKKI